MRVAWPHSPAHRLAVLSWLPVHFIIGLLNPYANDVPTSVLGVAVTLTANCVCQHCKKPTVFYINIIQICVPLYSYITILDEVLYYTYFDTLGCCDRIYDVCVTN